MFRPGDLDIVEIADYGCYGYAVLLGDPRKRDGTGRFVNDLLFKADGILLVTKEPGKPSIKIWPQEGQ